MNKKLTIAPYILMHYESKLDTYFFYNAKNDNFWETDKVTGSIVSILDGTNTGEDIINMLNKNSPDVPIEDLQEHFGKTFEFLLKEKYILECSDKRPSYSHKQKEVLQPYETGKKSATISTHTNISDKDYDKYVRYYLDYMFNPLQKDKKTLFKLNRIHHKQMMQYIKKYSGDENYLFSSPLAAFWNLTNACNFRCAHCLYNETEYSSKNDLTTEQALNLADELIEAGIVSVKLTGGEVFLRPDTMDIIKRFKENNIAVCLLTNGSLLTDEIIDEIAELFNPYTDEVRISFDAATDETFKKIRRSDKFGKINENIQKLTAKGVYVVTVCTVNNINKDEIIDIYNLSKALGANEFATGTMIDLNDSHYSLNVENRELFKIYYELSKNELFYYADLIDFWKFEQLLNIPEVLKILQEPHYQELLKKHFKEKSLAYDCQCHNKVGIGSDGKISLCIDALSYDIDPLGYYKNNSFVEIWERRWDNVLFQPRNREKSECGCCKYNTFCNGGCKIEAYIKSGSINAPAIPNCIACH